jgi:transcriptional regulator with XRE-family HTH domain
MRLSSDSAKKNIGSIIRERRINKGMSQTELAEKAKITQTFLSLVEHGVRVPSYDVLHRIAEIIGEDASNLEQEADSADSHTVVELNRRLKRLLGSGNKKKLDRLLEFIETLG